MDLRGSIITSFSLSSVTGANASLSCCFHPNTDMDLGQFSDTQNDDVIPGDQAPHAGSEDINGKYPAIGEL